jgi:hypothetical protein
MAEPCYTPGKELEIPYNGPPRAQFVPSLYEDDLLQCLTMSDVRQLSQFEFPTVSNPSQGAWPLSSEVDVSPGALPKDLYAASLVIDALLFFILIYFGSFIREAVASPPFPADGTLFSSFAKSRWSLLPLLIALCSPAIASAGVAAVSRRWPLIACAILVLLADLFASFPLFQRKYFSDLSPSRAIRSFGRTKPQ